MLNTLKDFRDSLFGVSNEQHEFLEALERELYSFHNPRFSIVLTWTVDDVISVAAECTLEQAMNVLRAVKHDEDCQYGVSWQTIFDEMDRQGIQRADG